MKGGELLGVAGGNWGHLEHFNRTASFHQQTHLLLTAPTWKSQHSLTWQSPHQYHTVRTLDRRTSWAPRRNSIKASAPFFKEPPLPSKPSFWGWVTPCTAITRWSLSRNWVSILKELRSLPPSSMCTLWTLLLNLSIPDGQACNPLDPHFPLLFAVEELYGTRYQSGSFSLINVGSGFHCLRSFLSFLYGGVLWYPAPKWLLFLT